jgi:hypothetical protein
MLHALQPAQLRRMNMPQLKLVAEHCERALLSGTSTHQDMMTLIEVEKELLRRERIDTRQQLLEARKTLVGQAPASQASISQPSVTSSAILAPAEIDVVALHPVQKTSETLENQERLELLPVAPNRY